MENAEGFDEKFLFENFEDNDTPDDDKNSGIALLKKAKKIRKEKRVHKGNWKETLAEESSQSEDNIENPQNRYIAELELQNAKLKAIIKRMVGPQACKFSDGLSNGNLQEINLLEQLEDDIQSKPFAVVLFLNNDISNAHRKEVHEFMKTVSEKKANQEVLMTKKFTPHNSAIPLKSFAANPLGKRSSLIKVKDKEEHHVISACQYYKSFFLDRMGCPLLSDNPGITDIWDVPSYQQLYLKALPFVEETLNIRVRQIKQCFNCGGEHHLADCKEPRDNNRINEARQQHAAQFKSPSGYDNRYHVTDEENSERFKYFKAGEISTELEEALGISLKSELPPYIYKMRYIGYPPGWLKPAEEGLKMYGAEGNVIDDPDTEEGEIKPVKLPAIISYPGYNAPVFEGVADRATEFGMLPYQPELAELDIAKKRALIIGYVPSAEPLAKRLRYEDAEPSDMEVEDDVQQGDSDNPPLPLIETADQLHKPPPPPESGISESDNAKEEGEITDENADTSKSKANKTKTSKSRNGSAIDETTYRSWFVHEPLTSVGITYFMYTPPPTMASKVELNLSEIPRLLVTDLDREPWKSETVSWYDPLYGDLAAPTGTFDAIRGLLKQSKRKKRKPML